MYLCFLIELPFSPPCYFHRCFVSRLSSHFQIKRKLPYLAWIRILLESQVPTVKKKEKRKISGFNGAETLPQNAGKAASAPHRRPGSGGVPPPLSLPSPPASTILLGVTRHQPREGLGTRGGRGDTLWARVGCDQRRVEPWASPSVLVPTASASRHHGCSSPRHGDKGGERTLSRCLLYLIRR